MAHRYGTVGHTNKPIIFMYGGFWRVKYNPLFCTKQLYLKASIHADKLNRAIREKRISRRKL